MSSRKRPHGKTIDSGLLTRASVVVVTQATEMTWKFNKYNTAHYKIFDRRTISAVSSFIKVLSYMNEWSLTRA